MPIVELLEDIANPSFAALLAGISVPGQTAVAESLIVIAAAALALRRQWLKAVFMLATSSSLAIIFFIKVATARPRPIPETTDRNWLLFPFEGSSFPSGHAVFYTVFFGMLGYLAWVHLTGYLRWAAVTVCAALILLVGPSRVFLGAHWPSDVVGGYLIGGAWLMVLVGAYDWARSRPASTKE
ncbi:MAG: phosphatase PAP2 family protein [Dehalococcoidia bacterium]|nr:phosphatase PAP2 family protein [Dehalococcoidia bacterium]